MNQLTEAIMLAAREHDAQVDKAGRPYILHVLRVVVGAGPDLDAMTVAALHDVLEDTGYSEVALRLRFPAQVVDAVVAITKVKGESLEDYYARVKANPLALMVKRADLEDNAGRLDQLEDEATRARLTAKYSNAAALLGAKKKTMSEAAINQRKAAIESRWKKKREQDQL